MIKQLLRVISYHESNNKLPTRDLIYMRKLRNTRIKSTPFRRQKFFACLEWGFFCKEKRTKKEIVERGKKRASSKGKWAKEREKQGDSASLFDCLMEDRMIQLTTLFLTSNINYYFSSNFQWTRCFYWAFFLQTNTTHFHNISTI